MGGDCATAFGLPRSGSIGLMRDRLIDCMDLRSGKAGGPFPGKSKTVSGRIKDESA